MRFSNRDTVRKLKRNILVSGILFILVMTALIFFEMFVLLAITAALFVGMMLWIAILNFQNVQFIIEDGKVIVRYFSVFSIERSFNAIEFRQAQFRKIRIAKYFFGQKWDLIFTVRIRSGMADYPPVSLSSIPQKERLQLIKDIEEALGAK